jgi:Protein of unknown function (DUF2795)
MMSSDSYDPRFSTDDPQFRSDQVPDEIARLRRRFEEDSPQAFPDYARSRFDRITSALGVPAFPADRDGLLDLARAHGAADSVVVALRSLAPDARFESYDALLLALGVGSAGRIDVPGAPARDPQGGAPSLPD